MEKHERIMEERLRKIAALEASGLELFPSSSRATHTVAEVLGLIDEGKAPEPGKGEGVCLAGRMMAINSFGKSAFVRFRDRTGLLQAYVRKDKVGDEAYSIFKQLDVGDFIETRGGMFQTKTGEWTLLAEEIRLLSKAFRPLPEKFHGLKDPEKRYRKRYLDLIMNADVREIFIKRSKAVQAIREFLLKRGFMEVETPMMQPVPGGAEARPFVTHHNALDMDLFLRIAPELYLKRLVVGGFERVFEINRNFRNEGVSTRHNPEFTMLEFYQAYAEFGDLMDMTEEMFRNVAEAVTGSSSIVYQGCDIDFSGKWRRLPLIDALHEIGGVDKTIMSDTDSLLQYAKQKGVTITKADNRGKVLMKLFDTLVQPHLVQPTFITTYPVEVSPLSRASSENPGFTDRFELFIGGNEIANGFSELNDPREQRDRFLAQVKAREAGDDEAHLMDEDYIEALEYGMPPTAGEGVGIDRLVMLLTDSPSIREVILFPHMRREERA